MLRRYYSIVVLALIVALGMSSGTVFGGQAEQGGEGEKVLFQFKRGTELRVTFQVEEIVSPQPGDPKPGDIKKMEYRDENYVWQDIRINHGNMGSRHTHTPLKKRQGVFKIIQKVFDARGIHEDGSADCFTFTYNGTEQTVCWQ